MAADGVAARLLGDGQTNAAGVANRSAIATRIQVERTNAKARLAAVVGLDVAPAEPRVVRDRTFLLVDRYDRFRGKDGMVRRIHQEDFCQALGVLTETKYASEGGPTSKDCFELRRRVAARPTVDVLKLLDAVITINTAIYGRGWGRGGCGEATQPKSAVLNAVLIFFLVRRHRAIPLSY